MYFVTRHSTDEVTMLSCNYAVTLPLCTLLLIQLLAVAEQIDLYVTQCV